MDDTVARYLFSEMPYAFAISPDFITVRCMFCLSSVDPSNSYYSCEGGCCARYCDQPCLETDRQYHQYECSAMRNGVKLDKSTDMAVRLLGRMMSRYQSDGGVASLSMDFPHHSAKDRRVSDLMTHEKEIRRSTPHTALYERIQSAFFPYYRSTPLAGISEAVLFKFFCRYVINGFSVMIRLRPQPGYAETMGEAIYLNASRFDHSCRPTCLYRFDGVRLLIEYLGRNEGKSSPWQMTRRQFNSLTIQYGFGSRYTNGVSCPLAKQRIKSLQRRYFFRCRCELCSNHIKNEIQRNAASVECALCSWPYVWRKSKLYRGKKLKKSCRCRGGKQLRKKECRSTPWLLDKQSRTIVKELSTQWKLIVPLDTERVELGELITNLSSVVHTAEKFWSTKYNLRLAHLNEKLFDAYWAAIFGDDVETTRYIDKYYLDKMLKAGEDMLSIYAIYYELYQTPVAKYAQDVAMLYKIRSNAADDDDYRRAMFWYGFAINIWKRRGEINCQHYVEEQASAQAICKVKGDESESRSSSY